MIIDCESCVARPAACGDCVVGVLLGRHHAESEEDGGYHLPSGAPALSLDAPERRALDVLAEQGLVPRLRLVAVNPRRTHPDVHPGESDRDVG